MATRTKTFGCILAVLVCLFAFAPKAEAKQDAFKSISPDSWTLPAFDALSVKYLKVSFTRPHLITSGGYPTRYEAAISIMRILEKVEKIDEEKSDKKTMVVPIKDRILLKRLVIEFWKVLLAIGYFGKHSEVTSSQEPLEYTRSGYALDIVAAKFMQSPFLNHSQDNYLFGSHRPPTRYETASMLSRILRKVRKIDTGKRGNHTPAVTEEDGKLLQWLVEEFKQELTALGYDVKPFLGMTAFPDVPKTHWAFNAVAELKWKGVLVGYPNPIENTFLPEQTASR